MSFEFLGIALVLVLSFTVAPGMWDAADREKAQPVQDLREREEVRNTYPLSLGARVEILGVQGYIDIEPTDGNTAEVHIIRSAQTRAELSCQKVLVEATPAGLVLRNGRDPDCPRYVDEVRNRIQLKVPRNTDIIATGVNGNIKMGDISGNVRISGHNGHVEGIQRDGYYDLSQINGYVTISILGLGSRGLRMSGVNGKANLLLADNLNANLEFNGIAARVNYEKKAVQLARVGESDYSGHIGADGPPIQVSSITGTLTICTTAGARAQAEMGAFSPERVREQGVSGTASEAAQRSEADARKAQIEAQAQEDSELRVTRETVERYQLAPGATVQVSMINGPVEIETASGDSAELHFYRMAETQEHIGCCRLVADHTMTRLALYSSKEQTEACRDIRIRQRVKLLVPRQVNISLRSINGSVTVAEIDGTVSLNSIQGDVKVAHAEGYLDASTIGGNITVGIRKIGSRGISLNSINGKIELLVAKDLNANVSVSNSIGNVNVETPVATMNKAGRNFKGQVGSGGPLISVSSIRGTVVIGNL